MAAGRLLIPSWMPALDSDGDPISGVKAYFYVNLTTSLASVYADEALTVPLANPVEANSSGRFPAIWADGDVLYSVAIEAPYGPAGVPFSYDNLSVSLGADIATAEAAEAAADEASAALADVLAAIEAATQAGGGDAAVAGALAGTAAANAALTTKANTDLGNVTALTGRNSLSAAARDGSDVSATAFRTAIGALPLDASGATTAAPDNLPFQATGGLLRSLGAKAGQEQRSIFDFASTSRTGAQNTAGLTAALASGKLVHTDGAGGLSFPINGPIAVSAGAALIDPTGNSQAKIVCEAGNYSIFQRQGAYTTIQGIGIDATLNTAGAVFEHQISGDLVETRVSDVLIEGAYQIWKETFSSGKSFRTYLSNVKALAQRGPGYVMEHEFAFTYLDELCLVEYLNSASPNHTAFYYDGAIPGLMGAGGGLHLGLQIGGSKAISATSAQKGLVIKNTGGVWFRGARADTLGGEACLIDTCNNVHFESFEAALNDGIQLRLKDSQFIFGSGMIALRGRNDQATKTADVDNMVIEGAGSGFMTFPAGIVSQEATGHGALVDAGSVVLMSEYVGKSNTKRGIRTTSNAGIFVNKGGAVFGNVLGNYDLATANHHLRDIVLDSGALVNGVGPSTL